jgi:hypothetical protein
VQAVFRDFRGTALAPQSGSEEKMMERFGKDFEPLPGSAIEGVPVGFRIETVLRKCGIDDATVDSVRRRMANVEVKELVKKFNRYARENPAVILGALCALAVGGTLVAKQATRKSATRRTRSAKTRSASTRRTKKASSKRTLIEPHKGDKRFVRRDAKGRIKESVDVGRSLAADRRRHSKSTAKSGQGDKGDR